MQFPNGTAFDPNAVPLAPELAAPIYGWIRRLALQADLTSADKLLRDAIADLTSSLSVVIIYAGPDGFYTLGPRRRAAEGSGADPRGRQDPPRADGSAQRARADLDVDRTPSR